MPKQYKLKNYKFTLILLVVILNIIGILLVGSASPGDQQKQLVGMLSGLLIMAAVSCIDYSFLLRFSWVIYIFAVAVGSASPGDQQKQLVGMLSGLLIMAAVSCIDYSFLLRFSWVIYIFAVALLVFVFVAGDDAGGAQRWFEIGGFRFQPSELVKILVILFFAYYFMKYEEKVSSLPVLCRSFLLVGVILALIIAQPNLSTTIIMALIFCAMLFIAGLSYKIIAGVLLTCVPAFLVFMTLVIQDKFPFIRSYQMGRIMAWLYPEDYPDIAFQQQNSIMAIGSGLLFGKGQDKFPFIRSYQMGRIMAWLYPEDYPDIAFQQQNSIMAIGSGLLFGKGLGNTDPASVKNGNFIIEPQNDFIFAVAGEELGFLGTAAIIILLLFITIECIFIARKAKDLAGRLICCGVAALIGFQSLINIGVASGLLPNTGVTLPFVSYGLTSLWSLYIGIGLVLNVGLQPKKY